MPKNEINNIPEEDVSIAVNPEKIPPKREKREKSQEIEPDQRELLDRAGKVVVNLESKNRFGEPKTFIFDDYTTEHVAKLTMTNPEDIMETIVIILNDLQEQEERFEMSNLTLESFLEILVAIKRQYAGNLHTHFWMCDCQLEVDKEQREYNEATIDLASINYSSIEEIDVKIRENLRPILENMSDKDFKRYLHTRYELSHDVLEELETWTVDQELENTKVKEPFFYKHPTTGDVFGFNLMRVGDIIEGAKIAKKKFEQRKYAEKKKRNPPGVKLGEFKKEQENILAKLDKEEGEEIIICINGLSLVSFNGAPIENDIERIEIYRKLKRGGMFEIGDFLQEIQFGINHEFQVECHCGHTDGRLLQQSGHPVEFLPLDTDTKRKQREHSSSNIFFSV